MTQFGLYAIGTSTTLESNKSVLAYIGFLFRRSPRPEICGRSPLRDRAMMLHVRHDYGRSRHGLV
jgi:hypothetical protein